jgi:hypothetical protein
VIVGQARPDVGKLVRHDPLVDQHLVADRRMQEEVLGWHRQQIAGEFAVALGPVRSGEVAGPLADGLDLRRKAVRECME